jgi:hypothetical protein
MCFSPKLDELIKMFSRRLQDVLHIAATRIARPYRVVPIGQCDFSVRPVAEFHDDLSLSIKSVHVTGLMVLRVGYKTNTIKPKGAHTKRIRRNPPKRL